MKKKKKTKETRTPLEHSRRISTITARRSIRPPQQRRWRRWPAEESRTHHSSASVVSWTFSSFVDRQRCLPYWLMMRWLLVVSLVVAVRAGEPNFHIPQDRQRRLDRDEKVSRWLQYISGSEEMAWRRPVPAQGHRAVQDRRRLAGAAQRVSVPDIAADLPRRQMGPLLRRSDSLEPPITLPSRMSLSFPRRFHHR